MALKNDKSLLKIGRGLFFAKAIDDSVGLDQGEGFEFAHQVSSIQYSPNETKLEEIDCTSGSSAPLASITTSRKPQIKITDKSFLSSFMRYLLMGTKNVLTQAATAVTAEMHANVKVGTLVPFVKMGPVTGVTVKDEAGTTTYALNTDYTIELADGLFPFINIVDGSTIVDGQTIQLAYTPTAYTSVEQVAGGTKSDITCALRFISATDATGPHYFFDVWKASVNVEGALEFIQSGNEFGSFDLTFTLLDDSANHPGVPFIDLRRTDNAVVDVP